MRLSARIQAPASACALVCLCLLALVLTNVAGQQSTSWTIEHLDVRICSSDVMNDGVTVIAGGWAGEVYKSPDQGLTWQKIWQHPAWTDRMDLVFVDSRNTIFVAGTHYGIYRSVDGGASFQLVWSEETYGDPVGSYQDSMAEVEDGTLYLGVVNQGGPGGKWILKSTDGGATWSHLYQLAGKHVHFVRYNPLTHWLYADSEYTTFRSKDYGDTWEEIANRDTSGVKMGVLIRGRYVYLSTHTFPYDFAPSWDGRVYRFYDDGSTPADLDMVFEDPPGDPKLFNVMRKTKDNKFLLLGTLSYKTGAGHKYGIWVSESGDPGTWSVLTEDVATVGYGGYGWMSQKWSKNNWLFVGNNDPEGQSLRIRPPQQTSTTITTTTTTDQSTDEEAVNVNLSPGYNLIGLPVINNSFTASSLLLHIGNSARSIFMFDVATQEYVSYDQDLADFGIPQPDFAIEPNAGYFVYGSESTTFLVTGTYAAQRDIQLHPGYNLIGWTTDVTSKAKSAFVDPSGGIVKAVSMLDVATQEYVSYDQDLADFGIPQPDFDILPGHGYFVYATDDLVLNYQD